MATATRGDSRRTPGETRHDRDTPAGVLRNLPAKNSKSTQNTEHVTFARNKRASSSRYPRPFLLALLSLFACLRV